MKRVSDLYSNKKSSKQMIRNKYLHKHNIRKMWCKDSDLLYEPDSERIAKLNDSLNREFPIYSECLQKVKELF